MKKRQFLSSFAVMFSTGAPRRYANASGAGFIARMRLQISADVLEKSTAHSSFLIFLQSVANAPSAPRPAVKYKNAVT